MAEPKTSLSGNAGARLPLHPKLRKILVESKNGEGGSSSLRARNSPAAGAERCERSAAVGAGSAARRKPTSNSAQQHQQSSSGRRSARAPSPVLTQSTRRGQLQLQDSPGPSNASKSNSLAPAKRSSIPKSASVPANLSKDEPAQRQPSILKRSSSFLASALEPRSFCSLLRRRRQRSKKHSPERPSSPERSSPTVRKCVSFSSDTSFAERRAGTDRIRKTALHEAKQYRKGVLQDRNGCGAGEETPTPTENQPLPWEESLGGPRALLGAAQDGDDELIKKIVGLASKSGLGSIDVNAFDASGRTAISYMAGNGSALMLEACLGFPAADANLPDNEGNTPLHFAAQAGQTECLNILLQRCTSIEVDARNNLGFTPLMKAALQGRTKCAKILLFAGANPTLRDHGRGLRAEQWARFCGRYVCAEVIERFARHRLLEKTTSCRWGSEPELAAQVLQGKLMAIPSTPAQPAQTSGLKSKIRRVFRTSSNSSEKSFSLVSQLTSAALCASSPVLPKPGDVSPVVKSLLRPLSVPQLRITLVAPQDIIDITNDKCGHSTTFTEKIESSMVKPPRTKKKNK